MKIELLVFAAVGSLLLIGLVTFWIRWQVLRYASRALDRALHPDKHEKVDRRCLEPESRFIVHLSEKEVVCERPDGKVERVEWADLQKVEVVTTSDGPLSPDFFWVLYGPNNGCAIPQGATGEGPLLERLQALPGFDNKTLLESLGSTSDRRFLCWQRAA